MFILNLCLSLWAECPFLSKDNQLPSFLASLVISVYQLWNLSLLSPLSAKPPCMCSSLYHLKNKIPLPRYCLNSCLFSWTSFFKKNSLYFLSFLNVCLVFIFCNLTLSQISLLKLHYPSYHWVSNCQMWRPLFILYSSSLVMFTFNMVVDSSPWNLINFIFLWLLWHFLVFPFTLTTLQSSLLPHLSALYMLFLILSYLYSLMWSHLPCDFN